MKMRQKGFTLVELVVAIVITAIVVLMAAYIGSVASVSYHDLYNKSNVYADSQSALNLIRESVRQSLGPAEGAYQLPTVTGGNCLTVTVPITGGTTTTSIHINGTSLVYGSSCGSVTSTLISNVTNLVFTPNVSGLPLVTAALSGSKKGVNFSYSISVIRRNP